jgi:ribosomal protein S18 acetylase RimI-like enzyme
MQDLLIQKASISDLSDLQSISQETFRETFAAHNTAEDMDQYLAAVFNTAQLTKEINHSESNFYLAILNNKLIGYLKVNFGNAQTEIKDQWAMEMERIYILKAYSGRSIGTLLLRKALSLAKEEKLRYIWLGVWEHNLRAIRFYENHGFVPFDKHIFKLGSDLQTDILMKREID